MHLCMHLMAKAAIIGTAPNTPISLDAVSMGLMAYIKI